MANAYSEFTTRLVSALTALLSGYPATVERNLFDPQKLPDFERYHVVVSPPQNDSWRHDRVSIRTYQPVLAADVYLLVKNFNDHDSLFGETGPDLGIFQMISDVQYGLQISTLNGFLQKTYEEGFGPLSIEYAASAGFDSGEHSFVRRARLRVTGKAQPICVMP